MTYKTMTAVCIDEEQVISLADLCRSCTLPAERVFDMIEYGIIEPIQRDAISSRWVFSATCVPRLNTAIRLQRDLDINLAGAALALELLDELKILRRQLQTTQQDS